MARKVFFIGLGLIGGSIALAIKKKHEDAIISAFDISQEQLKMAKSLGVIDEIAINIEEGVSDADLIVLAAPVQQTVKIIEEIASYSLKSSVIITDVGSTKHEIVQKAKIFEPLNITFIGGHPMAGSHKTGVIAAKSHLFENAFYILTPTESVCREKVKELMDWLSGTHAKFLELSPDEHDEVAGAISHFPHIIAASLVHQAAELEKRNTIVSSLAAGGFRDITRIASASPVMWRDILVHNKRSLLELLDQWKNEMEAVRTMILNVDSDAIYHYFKEAKEFRDKLPQRERGALPSFYDLYVDVPDHPGAISEVTGVLAKEEISITNIRIIEAREDILGVLRLSFQNESDRREAISCLENHQYETYLPS